jgi:hypothetical protein
MQVDIESVDRLRFADGSPVRAASAVVPFGDGFLVAQDDATHAAWERERDVTPVRLFPPIRGLDVFDEASGTKHLKPDLEAACSVEVDGSPAVLLLGSGSSPARMRSVVLRPGTGASGVVVTDLTPLYPFVADALGVPADVLNMEGACRAGDAVRWYHRGLPSAGMPSGSVDLDAAALVAAALGLGDPGRVPVGDVRSYDLGEVEGVGLAVTDAVALPGGEVLVSTAAEDSPTPRDDGPVVGSALVRLSDAVAVDRVALPLLEGEVCKVEGLALLDSSAGSALLLAVVDADDPAAPSLAVRLRLRW